MQPIRLRLFSFIVFLLAAHLNSVAQQDCFDAISVCSNNYVENSSFAGVGNEQEVVSGTTCLGNGEVNSVWYTFTTSNAGTLEFQLNPLNPSDDYDFALYNLTNDSCTGISAGLNLPVSCNYSADPGSTGLSSSGSGNNNGSNGPNQNATVSVQAGETYALLICNFTASLNGYELNFSGSASIGDTQAAVPDSVSTRNVCNPLYIYLFFDEPFDCSTISPDGSEITISGPETTTVASLSGVGCNQGFTDQIRIRLTGKIQTTGIYTITINTGTDGDSFADGCGNEVSPGTTFQFEVEFIGPEIDIINIQHTSCGQDDGQAEADVYSGTPPYTYSWNTSPGQTTAVATGLESGSYRVTVYDANGCLERANVVIENNSPIDLSNYNVTAVSCNGSSDGTAQLIPSGGVSPYDISWDSSPAQSGQNASGLPGGEILVTVTDGTGCEELVELNIPEPAAINLSTTIVNPDCGVSNGSATANVSGGTGVLSYSWNTSPAQNTAMATGLQAGVYTVVVTDQNGCQKSSDVILSDNFAPNASIESTVPDCGQTNGQATAIATSGTAPYSYQWSTDPPQNTATATGLSEGDYFVTITDAAGCVQIINVKIDTVAAPVLSGNITQPNCGMADGEIEVSVTNGIQPFTFNWSSSSNTTALETGLAEGSYTVTLTDSTGCTATGSFQLTQLEPESEIIMNDVCLGDETSFSFTTTSGATSWLWDFGDGTTSTDQNPTHTYTSFGDFNVMLTLNGGCMPDEVINTTTVYELPTADFAFDPEIPTTRTPVSFLYTGNGGNTFQWDLGDGTTGSGPRPTHLYGMEGAYDVFLTVTDENGCEDTVTQTIDVLLQPVIYLPNAFIPEGTDENSRFKGYGIGVTGVELSIFDRWGTLIYFSSDMNEIMTSGWDGNYNGKPARQGAYAYKVKASFYNNTTFEKLGTVTLIR